ncbi:MAG TPA: DUF389 domain-containing protein [Dissulfurispiraceae bacterium]|nr:DUF389 domain-containing protein [Dissulfurispiraceae bacterium]
MKIIEVIADKGSSGAVSAIAERHEAHDFLLGFEGADGRQVMQLLVRDDKVQEVIDSLQSALEGQPSAKILVVPLDVSLPMPPEEERTKEEGLGPNRALGFGTALGDVPLMRKSLVTNVTGIGVALALSIAIGMILPFDHRSSEIMSRTDVGLESVVLALASGAAAAMSLTTGLSSILVGVMVAVALLPPTVTVGLMLGQGRFTLAAGAALLLAVNLVCVNLSAKIVFMR